MPVAEFDNADYESEVRRTQSAWTRANAERDASRVADRLAAQQVRRSAGPVFGQRPQLAGTAIGRAVASRIAEQAEEQRAEEQARAADLARHIAAQAADRRRRTTGATPKPCAADRAADAEAKRISREIFGDDAA